MSDSEIRVIQLLEEMRDLLRDEVRLRQVSIEEQRAFQAKAQASIDAAARKQHRSSIITALSLVVLLVLWFGISTALPLLLGAGSLIGAIEPRARGASLIPSAVDTSLFDGTYSLLEERSFHEAREKVRAESDPQRRLNGEKLLAWQADRYRNFAVHRGVIRSGAGLTQEFSLRQGTLEGQTLRGRAIWHEDTGDPGDASEEAIMMRLDGDVLEFAMLGDQGTPLDSVFLQRAAAAGR